MLKTLSDGTTKFVSEVSTTNVLPNNRPTLIHSKIGCALNDSVVYRCHCFQFGSHYKVRMVWGGRVLSIELCCVCVPQNEKAILETIQMRSLRWPLRWFSCLDRLSLRSRFKFKNAHERILSGKTKSTPECYQAGWIQEQTEWTNTARLLIFHINLFLTTTLSIQSAVLL